MCILDESVLRLTLNQNESEYICESCQNSLLRTWFLAIGSLRIITHNSWLFNNKTSGVISYHDFLSVTPDPTVDMWTSAALTSDEGMELAEKKSSKSS